MLGQVHLILYFIFSIAFNCIFIVLTFETDPKLQRNILKFGNGINYKYEGQLPHSIDRYYVVVKFKLPKLIDILLGFNRMPVDYNNCFYSSHKNEVYKYTNSW